MVNPSSYCEFVASLPAGSSSVHRRYHDQVYGFPVRGDKGLFERLILEINQAGLSWTTILNKQPHFRRAYDGFSIEKVAGYGPRDERRLMSDTGIIRNRLKIQAAIHNARVVRALQKSHGSFRGWLDEQGLIPLHSWVALFRKTFRFTGGEITREFLVSTGYLPGAHQDFCPVARRAQEANPAWRMKRKAGTKSAPNRDKKQD